MKTYLFVGSDIRGFKLAVRAVSLASARRYVAAQASSVVHRALKYAGTGDPHSKDGWCGAVARCGLTGKDY